MIVVPDSLSLDSMAKTSLGCVYITFLYIIFAFGTAFISDKIVGIVYVVHTTHCRLKVAACITLSL